MVEAGWQPVVQLKTAKLVAFVWQAEQGFPECRPDVIGNQVWLKTPCVQAVSVNLWQESQVVGKPAAVWLGFVVAV